MEMKTTLKLCISSSEGPKGVFIGIREKGGQGTDPGPKRGRSRDHTVAARGPVCPLSGSVSGFVFAAPGFAESAPLGQWL